MRSEESLEGVFNALASSSKDGVRYMTFRGQSVQQQQHNTLLTVTHTSYTTHSQTFVGRACTNNMALMAR